MENYDDELSKFEADGAQPLPDSNVQGYIENAGARIWYAAYGSGVSVILLHGGLGHSGNWGYQVPALVESGYCVVVIDSRGHGRSTRDAQPYSYELMASDVLAVMDKLNLEKAAFVGWSDGACIAMILASQVPERVAGVFFFACNMDPSGTKEFEFTPILGRCINRHKLDYAELSPTPEQFDSFSESVGLMQRTQPNYSTEDLAPAFDVMMQGTATNLTVGTPAQVQFQLRRSGDGVTAAIRVLPPLFATGVLQGQYQGGQCLMQGWMNEGFLLKMVGACSASGFSGQYQAESPGLVQQGVCRLQARRPN